jgi:hypothetical protein
MTQRETERNAERELAATFQETGKALVCAHRDLTATVQAFCQAVAWGYGPRQPVSVYVGPDQPLKRRRRWRQDPIRAAITQKWGSDWPPDTLPTPEALRELDHELERLGIIASPDSKKRAMGRRD